MKWDNFSFYALRFQFELSPISLILFFPPFFKVPSNLKINSCGIQWINVGPGGKGIFLFNFATATECFQVDFKWWGFVAAKQKNHETSSQCVIYLYSNLTIGGELMPPNMYNVENSRNFITKYYFICVCVIYLYSNLTIGGELMPPKRCNLEKSRNLITKYYFICGCLIYLYSNLTTSGD